MTKREIARRYRAQGYTYVRIGQLMGVSMNWARALCIDKEYDYRSERALARQSSGKCPECGEGMTLPQHGVYQGGRPHERCAKCDLAKRSAEAFARNVVGETLRCRMCKEYKSFSSFPQGVLARYLDRRKGKPPNCTACDTAARTAYRLKHESMPCVQCGATRFGDPIGRRLDTGLCLSCYRESRAA